MACLFWYFNKGPFSSTKQKRADDNRGLLYVTAVKSIWLELTPGDGVELSEANCPSLTHAQGHQNQMLPAGTQKQGLALAILCKFQQLIFKYKLSG